MRQVRTLNHVVRCAVGKAQGVCACACVCVQLCAIVCVLGKAAQDIAAVRKKRLSRNDNSGKCPLLHLAWPSLEEGMCPEGVPVQARVTLPQDPQVPGLAGQSPQCILTCGPHFS